MTREEAIKGLETLSKSFSGYKPNEEMFEMAISALKIQDKLLDTLNGFESDLPCDESPDDDWCAEHCEYAEPQNECWIRWARGALGLPLEEGVQKE